MIHADVQREVTQLIIAVGMWKRLRDAGFKNGKSWNKWNLVSVGTLNLNNCSYLGDPSAFTWSVIFAEILIINVVFIILIILCEVKKNCTCKKITILDESFRNIWYLVKWVIFEQHFTKELESHCIPFHWTRSNRTVILLFCLIFFSCRIKLKYGSAEIRT